MRPAGGICARASGLAILIGILFRSMYKVDAAVKIRIGQSEEMMSLASKFFRPERGNRKGINERAGPKLTRRKQESHPPGWLSCL